MERIVAGLAKTRSEIRGEIQKISAALRRKAEAADYRVRALQVAVDEAADLNVAQVKLQEMERNADANSGPAPELPRSGARDLGWASEHQ